MGVPFPLLRPAGVWFFEEDTIQGYEKGSAPWIGRKRFHFSQRAREKWGTQTGGVAKTVTFKPFCASARLNKFRA